MGNCEVDGSKRKEIHYFDSGSTPGVDDYKNGLDWYRTWFPVRTRATQSKKFFESTPSYLYHPEAPERIYSALPNIKLIAVLRNPTQRAISQYFHMYRKGRETLPIMEALQTEEQRIERIKAKPNSTNRSFRIFAYKARGRYQEQLSRYYKYFSRDQLLVLSSDLLFSNPDTALKKIFAFLGVDAEFVVPNLTPRNVGANKKELPQEVYDYLDLYFKDHNQKLYDLTGEDFGW